MSAVHLLSMVFHQNVDDTDNHPNTSGNTVAKKWYRSAVRRSVPLLCDSVATSVGMVVSVINILMEDHAEKMHGTHEHS